MYVTPLYARIVHGPVNADTSVGLPPQSLGRGCSKNIHFGGKNLNQIVEVLQSQTRYQNKSTIDTNFSLNTRHLPARELFSMRGYASQQISKFVDINCFCCHALKNQCSPNRACPCTWKQAYQSRRIVCVASRCRAIHHLAYREAQKCPPRGSRRLNRGSMFCRPQLTVINFDYPRWKDCESIVSHAPDTKGASRVLF